MGGCTRAEKEVVQAEAERLLGVLLLQPRTVPVRQAPTKYHPLRCGDRRHDAFHETTGDFGVPLVEEDRTAAEVVYGGWLASAMGALELIEEDRPALELRVEGDDEVLAAAVKEILVGCKRLMLVASIPWECPLVRPVLTVSDLSVRCYPPLPGAVELCVAVEVRLDLNVYVSRLLFEMIACDDIARIFSNLRRHVTILRPCAPPTARPRAPSFSAAVDVVPQVSSRRRHNPFKLSSILASMCDTGYNELTVDLPALRLRLLDHQRQTVQWMVDQEFLAHPLGLNGKFWETRSWAGAGGGDPAVEQQWAPYYYFPVAGELRLASPPRVSGGLLAEEMGLGKTLEVLALIAHDKSYRWPPVVDEARGGPAVGEEGLNCFCALRTTLVVMPPALLSQWSAEISKCSSLSWVCYLGKNDPPPTKDGPTPLPHLWAKAWMTLFKEKNFDLVLTSYNALEEEKRDGSGRRNSRTGMAVHRTGSRKVLTKIFWRRIVLDECQQVRSATSAIARTCIDLRSEHRWMVSGTPLHSSVNDLNGELAFLGVYPFCLPNSSDGFWLHKITEGLKRKDTTTLSLLSRLLSAVAMRHSKSQLRLRDGTPLISLPPRVWVARQVPLVPSLRYCYSLLESLAISSLNGVEEAGSHAQERLGPVEALVRAARSLLNGPRLLDVVSLNHSFRQALQQRSGLHSLGTDSDEDALVGTSGASAFLSAVDLSGRGMVRALRRTLFSVENVRCLSAADAIDHFLSTPTSGAQGQEDAERALRLGRQGMVETGVARQHHERARTYRVETVGQRLQDANARRSLLQSNVSRLEDARRGMTLTTYASMISHVARWPTVSTEYSEVWRAELELAQSELSAVVSYVTLLERAALSIGKLADANVVEQSGFKALMALVTEKGAQGLEYSRPTCPICYGPVLNSPMVLRCMHMGCGDCILQWYNAAPQLNSSARMAWERQLAEAGRKLQEADRLRYRLLAAAPSSLPDSEVGSVSAQVKKLEAEAEDLCEPRVGCPLCRQPFTCSSLIRIISSPLVSTEMTGNCEFHSSHEDMNEGDPHVEHGTGQVQLAQSLLSHDICAENFDGAAALPLHTELQGGCPDVCSMGLQANAPPATTEQVESLERQLSSLVPAPVRDPLLPALPLSFAAHLSTLCASQGHQGMNPKVDALIVDLRRWVFCTDSANVASAKDGHTTKRAVVFARSKAMVEEVRRGLIRAGIACACISQGQSNAQRFHAVEQFNDPNGGVLVLVLAVSTASAGLTLTAASHVILMEPLSSPGDISQAIGRVHRIGQRDRVTIWQYFVKGTVEERLLARLLQDSGDATRDFATLAAEDREGGAGIGNREHPSGEFSSVVSIRTMLGLVDVRDSQEPRAL